MHEDQVTQNARLEEARVYRHWDEFSDAEKAAALRTLATFMLERNQWSQEAAAVALLSSMRLDLERRTPSPVEWGELTRPELKIRLLEVAAWDQVRGSESSYLRDACLELAEDLNRQRSQEREGRER